MNSIKYILEGKHFHLSVTNPLVHHSRKNEDIFQLPLFFSWGKSCKNLQLHRRAH